MRFDARCDVRTLLAEARTIGIERHDALSLIGHGLGRTRTWLIAHDDSPVNEIGAAHCRELLNRSKLGEPLAYLVEAREFHGLELRVTPDVLIPRADTETLVDWALELLHGPLGQLPTPQVVDLGTGSGAIALAVKHACPRAVVTALDFSEAALDVARFNARELGLAIDFARSDWWSAVGGKRFDLALSNPPYIAAGDPHLPGLQYEPQDALIAGPHGLDDLVAIAATAGDHLEAGGWLLMEHGYDQGLPTRALFEASTWHDVGTRRDLAGHERCSGARWGLA